jgi:hypothetical protein
MHHQTVLKEQRRQRKAGVSDPDRIQQQVSHMSAWALRRAQRLATQDARDALANTDTATSSSVKRQSRRSSMHQNRTSAVPSTATFKSQAPMARRRRTSLPATTVTTTTTVTTSVSTSEPCLAVDVDQLKAWNARLLQRMLSDQRRNSMTNVNSNVNSMRYGHGQGQGQTNATFDHNVNVTRRNSGSHNQNNSNNNTGLNNNSINVTLNNNGSEMSLHSLLVAPRVDHLTKRAPDFLTSSFDSNSNTGGGGHGQHGHVFSNSSNTNHHPHSHQHNHHATAAGHVHLQQSQGHHQSSRPYQPFLRRDSLSNIDPGL